MGKCMVSTGCKCPVCKTEELWEVETNSETYLACDGCKRAWHGWDEVAEMSNGLHQQ